MRRLAWILVALTWSCTSYEQDACEPGMQIECECSGGAGGVQTCLEDGSGWGECDCCDCSGRECGPDPVCGESCGTCGDDRTCNEDGQCECSFLECGGTCCAQGQVCHLDACCSPDCADRVCGPDPFCGASCGSCSTDEVCTADGQCIPLLDQARIQVCVKDCIGDESGVGCAGVPSICSDAESPRNLRIDFGAADPGEQAMRTVAIRNLGSEILHVGAIEIWGGSFSQFRLGDSNLPGELAPGEQTELTVEYHPDSGGEHTSTLRIASDDIQLPEVQVALEAEALAPRLCVDPLMLDFGEVPTGETREMSFELSNCGGAELELMYLALTADSSTDFIFSELPILPRTLSPDARLDVRVRYSPRTPGSDHGGVEVYSDDPASDPSTHLTGVVSLMGSSSSRHCDLRVTPPFAVFGDVVSGGSATLDLLLSNVGNAACTFHSAQLAENSSDQEFSIVSAPDPATAVDPGETLQIRLGYAPVDLGPDAGVLSVASSDPDGDIRVDISGTGVATAVCDLQVTPLELQLGTVQPGHTSTGTIRLQNTGAAICTLSEIEMRPDMLEPGEFSLLNAQTPLEIDRAGRPGSTFLLQVDFAPLARTGVHLATVWIDSDDPDLQQSGGSACTPEPVLGQACVPLEGLAAEHPIVLLPQELDFGLVSVGCDSPELRIVAHNMSGRDWIVSDIRLEDPQDESFEIRSAPGTPFSLSGGDSFAVRLRYHPQDDRPHRGQLFIQIDDPGVDLLTVPLQGQGTIRSEHIDVFFQFADVKTDVLFTVDNSGSMAQVQAALASYFPDFISRAILLGADFQIGVIGVEVNEAETGLGDPPRDIYPGVLVHAPGRPKILTPTTPDLETAFAENVSLGTCCADEQEAGLEATMMALSEPLVSDPAANAGFMREDAKLYVVCISNDTDQSMGSVEFYADFFETLEGPLQSEWIKLSAICGDSPNGCTGPSGDAGDGVRYIEAAERTGGIFESICTTDWSQTMQRLANDAFSTLREFRLSRHADPATIAVTVDAAPVLQASCAGCPDGWTYYPDIPAIFFGDNTIPAPGARIEVSYTAACL
ncbi:MAG: choice-of-anchor D domain-containing protein [Deltaproteobacteria bacterium]|nr:choice-of-anchor D domain-containing protein [Deltaproteobacteria bacterium]